MKKVLTIAALLALSNLAAAGNWPAWRGPTGQGHSDEKNLPSKWSDKENVRWKIDLENSGNSTPVIWGDKIFLTQANTGGSQRSLFCFAKADGKQLWRKDVAYEGMELNWNKNWYANASPAVDGERVVATFGSAGVFCFDHNGKELWKRTDLGEWQHKFGNGSSPVILGDTVFQWCGPNEGKGRNFLLAMDKKTGKTQWEKDEKWGSWSTPVIATVDGKEQLLLAFAPDAKGKAGDQTGYFKGYDPKTGNDLWYCRGLDSFQYTSPLYANGVAVGMSGYGGSALAVKLGSTGDITKDELWVHPKPANQRVGSGVIIGDHVYMIEENGVPHCYELKTGNEVWKADRLPGGNTWGSMVHADGKLYILMRNGSTHVLAAKPTFELLASNSLGQGEQTNSSIAVSDGDLYIRTFKHLYRISEKK